MADARAGSADVVPRAGLPFLALGPGILLGRPPAATPTGQSAPGFTAGVMTKATSGYGAFGVGCAHNVRVRA